VAKRSASADMPKKSVKAVMREFKAGGLHSGKGGPVVKNPKQAVAIALSMTGKAKPKVKRPKVKKK
jgi:hypothetical protein